MNLKLKSTNLLSLFVRPLFIFSVFSALLPCQGARATPLPVSDTDRLGLVGIDLQDIAELSVHVLPEAQIILDAMTVHPLDFFPPQITLGTYNPRNGDRYAGSPVLGVVLDSVPDHENLFVTAVIALPQAGILFRKFQIHITPSGPRNPAANIDSIQILADLPGEQTQFSIHVGLLQLKMILEDRAHGLRFIFPIATGGLDEGVSRQSQGRTLIMTPLFHNATINRSTADAHRRIPRYYLGRPYVPLTQHGHGWESDFAFHIYPTSRSRGPRSMFRRGFESHGCMRLRDEDLKTLYQTLMHQGSPSISVDVDLFVAETGDHPFPLRMSTYQTVADCSRRGEPARSCRDPDHPNLTYMTDVHHAPPPLSQIQAIDADVSSPRLY